MTAYRAVALAALFLSAAACGLYGWLATGDSAAYVACCGISGVTTGVWLSFVLRGEP